MRRRWRDNAHGVTWRSLAYAKRNMRKLGGVSEIRGYRFVSTRGKGDRAYTTDHEAVILTGPNGTMRLTGVLWGYN